MALSRYKLGELIGGCCHTDLFVPNGTHEKKAKVVRPEPIRVTKKGSDNMALNKIRLREKK